MIKKVLNSLIGLIVIALFLVAFSFQVFGIGGEEFYWDHSDLTYSFENESECSDWGIGRIKKAFLEFEEKTASVSFREDREEPDIILVCSGEEGEGFANVAVKHDFEKIYSVVVDFYDRELGENPVCLLDEGIGLRIEIGVIAYALGFSEVKDSDAFSYGVVDFCNYEIGEELIKRVGDIYG
jgi:hypothetical protein